MENNMSNSSSPDGEISPVENNVTQEGWVENSVSSGSSHFSSQLNLGARSISHPLHQIYEQTDVLEPLLIVRVPRIYLISNTLETVPDSWTNTRRFMSWRQAYICRIPKLSITNGIIRQTLKFISRRTLYHVHMKLRLMFRGSVVDEWQFEKGLVHREVVTRWESIINCTQDADYFDPEGSNYT